MSKRLGAKVTADQIERLHYLNKQIQIHSDAGDDVFSNYYKGIRADFLKLIEQSND